MEAATGVDQKVTGTTTPSFYQRELPETCVAFASREGKKIFASALSNNGLKSFFPLIQQFTTQTEPAYCGLSTLVLVLNALAVDPQQNWKGPWRWYDEKMLNCCLDLEDVKKTGITLGDFQCLAHCQGLSVDLTYCDGRHSALDDFRAAVRRACVDDDDPDDDSDGDNNPDGAASSSGQRPPDVLVVSYSRGVLGQTGTGHFSPLAAYDAPSDRVLILDTARFKYGAHWVKLPLIYDAMKPVDPDTGKSRGYVLLSFRPHHRPRCPRLRGQPSSSDGGDDELVQPVSVLFRSKMTQHPARREYKEFLASLTSEITWDDAVSYWRGGDKSKVSTVWSILEPLRLPMEEDGGGDRRLAERVRELVRELLRDADGAADPPPGCCGGGGGGGGPRRRCVGDREALYVVYLASLSEGRRTESVMRFDSPSDASRATRLQLLNEADLIATAISYSDESSF